MEFQQMKSHRQLLRDTDNARYLDKRYSLASIEAELVFIIGCTDCTPSSEFVA